MRYALAVVIAALTTGVAAREEPSVPEIAACRDIQDSLLRLRCFDDVSKPSTQKSPSVSTAPSKPMVPDFGAYAAAPYRGAVNFPDFRGRDRQHAMYRTRILAGAKAGPNFAGYLAMTQIGCGSSCSFVPVVDVRTGHVFNFPLGGEDNLSLDLKYRVDSRLVSAKWVDEDRCKQEELIWTGTAFQRGTVRDLGDREICYQQEN